jgi:glycosyltransferase involved in cell wall biosynthesis
VKDGPSATFLLIAYRQERFIREAVAGAFAQAGSPLEIVLSDDCSPDRTFDIMKEMADAYRGPHRIVLNRNPANLGLGGHVNRAVGLATGEFIVMAAGDDVSLEGRTETLSREWVRSGGGACSIYTDAVRTDPEGRETGRLIGARGPSHARSPEEAVARGGTGVAGCTHAFTRDCFDVFGPMGSGVFAEDMAIPFRSLLLGTVLYVDKPLVRYRTHGESISGESGARPTLAMRLREAENHEAVFRSWRNDLRIARERGLLPGDRAERMEKELSLHRYWLAAEMRYYRSGAFRGLPALASSAFEGGSVSRPLRIIERRFRTRGGARS